MLAGCRRLPVPAVAGRARPADGFLTVRLLACPGSGGGLVVDVPEEHPENGAQVPGPAVTAGFVAGLGVPQATDHGREDVHVRWVGDAGRGELLAGEREESLRDRVGLGAGFEPGDGPEEQQLPAGRVRRSEVEEHLGDLPHGLPGSLE